MKLLVGLGNPGGKYAFSRHNAGFMVIDRLALKNGIDLKEDKKKKSLVGKGTIGGDAVTVAKPQTFMNLSGEAVQPLSSYLKLNIDDIVVVHDEIDLDFGKIKVKAGGGHGGHNGLKSITSMLGDGGFTRLRVGVGRPPVGMDVSSYVLSQFMVSEKELLSEELDLAVEALESIVCDGEIAAMNRYN